MQLEERERRPHLPDELWNGGVSVTDKPANEINQTLKSSNANAAGSMSGVDSSDVSPSRTPGNPRDVEKLASELIAEHGELQPGLPLLKAAMKILQAHHPVH